MRYRDTLRPDGPLGPYAVFTYLPIYLITDHRVSLNSSNKNRPVKNLVFSKQLKVKRKVAGQAGSRTVRFTAFGNDSNDEFFCECILF